jgi:hypothetical protein
MRATRRSRAGGGEARAEGGRACAAGPLQGDRSLGDGMGTVPPEARHPLVLPEGSGGRAARRAHTAHRGAALPPSLPWKAPRPPGEAEAPAAKAAKSWGPRCRCPSRLRALWLL